MAWRRSTTDMQGRASSHSWGLSTLPWRRRTGSANADPSSDWLQGPVIPSSQGPGEPGGPSSAGDGFGRVSMLPLGAHSQQRYRPRPARPHHNHLNPLSSGQCHLTWDRFRANLRVCQRLFCRMRTSHSHSYRQVPWMPPPCEAQPRRPPESESGVGNGDVGRG